MPPLFADLQVRDPLTHQPLGVGQPGLLQVLSAIPGSYPGHSLLTEDGPFVKDTPLTTGPS